MEEDGNREANRPPREIQGPLRGLRILDLGLAGAGPIGPTLLAEWGAEVIKVEIPEMGNIMRRIPPLKNGQAFMHLIEGRHKRSLALDLHTPEGQEAVKRLIRELDIDIVLENYRPGTLERWNLGYEELKKVKEDLILVRVSGFGQEGPYQRRTSYDTVGVAVGGMHHLTGYPDSPPALVGSPMCDYITAAFNALASLIALRYRGKTGRGQVADIPQYEAIFRLSEWSVAAYDKLGLVRQRTGNRHPSFAPGDLYLARDDQWVAIEAPNDKIFARLCHAMGRSELVEDPRFTTIARRVEHADAINGIVAEWAREHDLKEVVDALVEGQVPVSPIYSTREVVEDPHYRARRSILEMEDPVMGESIVPGLVARFSRTPSEIIDTGVPIGAHNQEILREWLKFNEEQIAAAQGKGAGQAGARPSSDKGTPPQTTDRPAKPEREAASAAPFAPPSPALGGLRVLDVGTGLAGSFAATLLAEFGAEVIKVEEPGVGDTLRQMPPFYQGNSLWWAVEGRNKRSITLDLRKARGRELFRQMVATADVVIESFRPGTLERWGLGYVSLREVKPRHVLLRASSFGQSGPYRDRLSGEITACAAGGLTFLNGFPGRAPVRPGYSLASYTAGIFGSMAILAALQEREPSGEGQSIDLALYEPLLRFSRDGIPVYGGTGSIRQRVGSTSPLNLAGLFETREGQWVAVLAPEDKDFARLSRAMGQEELARDPRFNSLVTRQENIEALNALVADWVKEYTLEEVIRVLVEHEVPNGPVYDIEGIAQDPHYQARGNLIEVEDPRLGRIKMQDVVP
ncbi:MAG: CoA transferase, partial [Candidatus Tectomicrobia bacterium]|nr:CoA transferase [Candidatus Tectomicrobia bacterium]